jgi:hypothetical protein
MDEAVEWLEAELIAWWQVDAELESPRTSIARVQDLVLDNIDEPSSLAVSLSMAGSGAARGPDRCRGR